MFVFYNKAARKNPSKPKEAAKWYPVLRSTGMLKEREVAKLIADEMALNPKEAEMALSQLQKVIIRTLTNGQSIQLGDWSSLYLTLSSEGSATEKEVTPSKVKKINIRFLPGKELKEAIARAEFKDAEALTRKVTGENSSDTTPVVVPTPEAPDPSI